MSVVSAKLVICLACALLLLMALSRKERIATWAEPLPIHNWLLGLWAVFRLIPFLLVFIILGIEPTSDVNGFWYMATHAAEGKLVYRDFWSPYSPFYSYLLALGALVWNNPKVIVLIMLLMEGAAVWITYNFYRPILSKRTFIFRSLVYFLLPGSLVLCVLGAQEDVWMWLFFALAVVTKRATGRTVFYSLVLALGVLTSKAIFVLFLLPLFLFDNERIKFSIPLIITGLASLVILYGTVGDSFLQPMGEADTLRAPNVVSVLNPWLHDSIGMGESFWNWIGLFCTLLMGNWTAMKWRKDEFLLASSKVFVVMYATLMIVQQSAYSNYIFVFLLPLTLVLTDFRNRKFVAFLFVYNALCVIHPSYWWRSGMPKYDSPSDIFSDTGSITDYSMQLAIVLLTIYLIVYILKLPRAPVKESLKSFQ